MSSVPAPTYDELVSRVEIAEETLRVIHEGGVDALVVSTPAGPRIYTLQGADEFYRALVEQMGEGAAAVQRTGTLLYANSALARLLDVPLRSLIGSNILDHASGTDRLRLATVLGTSDTADLVELRLGRHGSTAIDVTLSARDITVGDGSHTLCLIISDRTHQRQIEAAHRRAQIASERERVARDLHDVVIQSLFAAGLRLNALGSGLGADDAARLELIVDDIDDTITVIRSSIFELRNPFPQLTLSEAIIRLVAETPVTLGFAAVLDIHGAIDTLVPVSVHHDITAVLRESLANAARHADATRVTIDVTVTPADFVLRVIDNGRGLPQHRVESGLSNLRARADELGGTSFAETNQTGRGTVLVWRIPLAPWSTTTDQVGPPMLPNLAVPDRLRA